MWMANSQFCWKANSISRPYSQHMYIKSTSLDNENHLNNDTSYVLRKIGEYYIFIHTRKYLKT